MWGREVFLPGVRYDDVVEGGVAFSETGEADFEDHPLGFFVGGGRVGWRWGCGCGCGCGWGGEVIRLFFILFFWGDIKVLANGGRREGFPFALSR
jgi:hypothetical protein